MEFKLTHSNINVTDLERSLKFYAEALDMKEVRRMSDPEGSYTIAWIANGNSPTQIELTWLAEHPQAYELGENESHIGFVVDDFDAAHQRHLAMDCICFENPTLGIYFIEDPDGYWIEVVPTK